MAGDWAIASGVAFVSCLPPRSLAVTGGTPGAPAPPCQILFSLTQKIWPLMFSPLGGGATTVICPSGPVTGPATLVPPMAAVLPGVVDVLAVGPMVFPARPEAVGT